ncbi:MAG: 2-succinyl-6-hydroxy-2,4-cyclohexadiene-1-carboxylate synthase [Calditrichia bacterium]
MPGLIDYHYKFYGERSCPLLIFLHGFMGSSEDWQEVIAHLSAEFYCLAIDLPYHGRTKVFAGPGELTFESIAGELAELFRSLGNSPSYLMGYSMGGRLSLHLALHFPELFRAVVLESASPGLMSRREREARIADDRQLAAKLRSGDFREFLVNWYQQPLFGELSAHPKFDELLNSRLRNDAARLANSLAVLGTGQQPSLWEKLTQLSVSCFLVTGEKDEKYVAISEEMHKRNKSIRLEIVRNCSHNVHFQKPGEFAKLLREFFMAV